MARALIADAFGWVSPKRDYCRARVHRREFAVFDAGLKPWTHKR
jgi:hypothetical protein